MDMARRLIVSLHRAAHMTNYDIPIDASISQRTRGYDAMRYTRRGFVAAMAASAGFGILFLALGLKWLALFNAASVLIYWHAHYLTRTNNSSCALLWPWLQIPAHATLATWLVGWDGGFHLFLLILPPLAFVNIGGASRPSWYKASLGIALIILLAVPGTTSKPAVQLPAQWLDYMLCFNIAGTAWCLAFLAYLYQKATVRSQDKLRRAAYADSLTGLRNRRFITERMLSGRRDATLDRSYSILIVDIDYFKSVNDTHGHATGDIVLKEFSVLLSQHARQEDLAARWGGEEFLVILPNTESSTALEVAERLRRVVEAHEFDANGSRLRITMSCGISRCTAADSLEQGIRNADAALYRAKQSGRNRVERGEHPDGSMC